MDEDLRLEEELLADPKERAEHIMLVDLGRNDLGRVCATGSVQVDELMVVERYSHVMHIVSNVSGQLAPGTRRSRRVPGDLPGRHPLRRAEDPGHGDHRGAGAVPARDLRRRGRLLSLSPATWTWPSPSAPWWLTAAALYLQAGAGIVADSDPAAEYQETVNKARGVKLALQMAREGLD